MRVLLLLLTGLIFINTTNGNFENRKCEITAPITTREGKVIAQRLGKVVGLFTGIHRRPTRISTKSRPAKNINRKTANVRRQTEDNNTIQTSYVSQQTIKSYARKYGISETRFYNLIIKESGGNVYARSPRGKYEGLGQWYRPYYNNQARVWGYVPNIYNANQHLEVTARAISEGQEFRWQNTY